MLKRVTQSPLPDRFGMGAKNLALDAEWSEPPVADIEVALLRNAAFPELGRQAGLKPEFVLLDPSTTEEAPSHEDLAIKIASCSERLRIPTVVIGNERSAYFGGGGFTHSVQALARLEHAEFASAFAALRERIGWVLASCRFSQSRHIVVPAFDASLLAVIVELLAELPPVARPFVHLATWWDEKTMPNVDRFGALHRFGRAIYDLNAERTTIFLYAWSRRLAQRLSWGLGVPVQPLDTPPELSLNENEEPQVDRFTVGYFAAPRPENGFGRVAAIIRAANRASANPRRTRFIVKIQPGAQGRTPSSVIAQKAELAAIADRNVSLIEDYVPRTVYFKALQQLDALLLPYEPRDGGERYSTTALHAMAAGKLVLTVKGLEMPGTVRNRVLTGTDERELGELIADAASDLAKVRAEARLAKSTYWATLRPSRLFAQLLYGPLVLADGAGADAI